MRTSHTASTICSLGTRERMVVSTTETDYQMILHLAGMVRVDLASLCPSHARVHGFCKIGRLMCLHSVVCHIFPIEGFDVV